MMRAKKHIYLGLIFPVSILLYKKICQELEIILVLNLLLTLQKAKGTESYSYIWIYSKFNLSTNSNKLI